MMLQRTNLREYLCDEESEDAVVNTILNNLAFYQNIDTGESALNLSGAIYNWFIGECVKHNHYIFFTGEQYEKLHGLYKHLVLNLRKISGVDNPSSAIKRIVKRHRKNLIDIIDDVHGMNSRDINILP